MTKLFEDPPAEISHSAHAEHELKLVTTGGVPFRCDGCMQHGDGSRYRCEPCNFESTIEHALFEGCTFVFLHEPTAPADETVCDACGDVVRGFVYHCYDLDLDLHPCCAFLPERIVQDDRTFELRKAASRRCGMCGENGRRRRFWAYRSYYDDGEAVYLHVACLKDAYRGRPNGAGAGQIVQACSPIMEGVLQSLPRRTRRSGGFERFRKIVGVVVGVIIAVIFGNPMAMIAAVAGPGGLLRG